jgi:hypothetical protein
MSRKQKMGRSEKKTLIHCWWKCKLAQPLWKSLWRFLKTLNVELPCDPVRQVLIIYPKEYKSAYNRDTCTPMFIAALLQ